MEIISNTSFCSIFWGLISGFDSLIIDCISEMCFVYCWGFRNWNTHSSVLKLINLWPFLHLFCSLLKEQSLRWHYDSVKSGSLSWPYWLFIIKTKHLRWTTYKVNDLFSITILEFSFHGWLNVFSYSLAHDEEELQYKPGFRTTLLPPGGTEQWVYRRRPLQGQLLPLFPSTNLTS